MDDVTTRTGACNGDFAPTLPAGIRARFSGFFGPLPSGCLAAINDPSRTELGRTQKWLLEQSLLHSTARFKIVLSEAVMQHEYVNLYVRLCCRARGGPELHSKQPHQQRDLSERRRSLEPDQRVFVDRATDPSPIASEFVTGPVAYLTDEQITLRFLGPTLGALAVATKP